MINYLHLDDHIFFQREVYRVLLEIYENIQVEYFHNNASALKFIENQFTIKKKLDFIITDYNHIGQNGLIFAQEVRKLEAIYYTKIPILLLTMRMDDYLTQVTNEGFFDVYFLKSISRIEIEIYLHTLSLE